MAKKYENPLLDPGISERLLEGKPALVAHRTVGKTGRTWRVKVL